MNDILKEARTILQITPLRWANLTENLSAGLLTLAPAPGEWSARDCLQHLVDAERFVFPVRARAILASENFPAFDPDSLGTTSTSDLSAVELAVEFARLREESLKFFDTFTHVDLARQSNHPMLGPASLSDLVHEWAGHDLMHTVQAERAVMQPFIQGSGPWKHLFADHIARQPEPSL